MRVAPALEGRAAVDLLLADVEAAGIADDTVDDGDLAVIAVADRVQPVHPRRRHHLDAARLQLPAIARVHAEERAERVVEDAHLDALGCLPEENRLHLLTDRV